jgi:hypothetical protein
MMDGVVETCDIHAAELDSFPYSQMFHFLDGLKIMKVRPILLHTQIDICAFVHMGILVFAVTLVGLGCEAKVVKSTI